MEVTIKRNESVADGLDALIAGGSLVGKIGWTDSDIHVDEDGKTQLVAKTALLNEFGYTNSKGFRVPARPFFRNTIRQESNNWLSDIERGAEFVLNNQLRFKDVLLTVTATAVRNVQATIRARVAPPLSPYTLRKRFENRIKLGLSLSNSTVPLVDTGQMVGTLTNEVVTG